MKSLRLLLRINSRFTDNGYEFRVTRHLLSRLELPFHERPKRAVSQPRRDYVNNKRDGLIDANKLSRNTVYLDESSTYTSKKVPLQHPVKLSREIRHRDRKRNERERKEIPG